MTSSIVVNLIFSAVFLSYLLQLTKVSALVPTIGFQAADSSAVETSGWINIALDRTVNTSVPTSVIVDVTGNATKDTDYIVSGSLPVIFQISNTSKSISIYIVDDTVVNEALETIILTIRANSEVYNITSTITEHIVSISDDDVSIGCQDTQISESAGTATVNITRTGSPEAKANPNSIRCFTKDDSAVASNDYTTENSAISFTANNFQQMNITIINDNIHEGNETFNVTCFTNDKRVHIQNSCKDAVVTIQNDDTSDIPTIGFNTSSSDVNEASGETTIYLWRGVRYNIPTTVTVNISGTATRNADFAVLDTVVSESITVTFPADDYTSKSIQIFIVNDEKVEDGAHESINLTIRADTGVINRAVSLESHVVNISDDDVNISCQDTQISESAETVTVNITRTGSTQARNDTHSIGCLTKDDSAVAPIDYTTTNSAISFTSPDDVQQMSITISNNTVPEGNETFKVRCYTNDKRVHILDSCKDAVVTIQNDDTYVFFCPGYQTLVREDAGRYSVDICRVGVTSASPTIQLCRTSEGGANASITAGCGDVNFAAYEDRKAAYIDITDDTAGEQERKTFEIYLESNDAAVTVNDTSRYDVTLQDDDNTFYLTDVSELPMTENTPEVNVSITIDRVGEISVAASVNLKLKFDSTASTGDCSGPIDRNITFSASETSITETVCTVVDDRDVEDDETFTITILGTGSPLSYVKAGKSERTVKLTSNDVLVTCQGESLKEADGPAIVTFNRTGATNITANNISCTTAIGTALSPTDFQSQTSETVSFQLDELAETFPVNLTNDRIVEGNEGFAVICNTTDPKVVVDASCRVQINIINDDTYVFFCPGYVENINESAVVYTARLCRAGVLEDTHTVQLCRSADIGSLPHDYPAVQATCKPVTFDVYDERKESNFTIADDTWGEQEFKTFNISINTTDPGVTFNDTTSYVVTIHDYVDNSFCFTNTTPTVYEEHDKYVNLTIRRTGGISVSNASVTINTSPQTAHTPEDYTEPVINQRLTFLVGETEKTVSVNIVNDKFVEDDQTFQLSLTGFGESTVFEDCKTSTVTIVSNDVYIFCNNRGFHSVDENKGPVVMDFTREGSLQYSHTMRIRTIDGTAKAGKDYVAIDNTLTFSPNQTNMIENVEIRDDNVLESSETFSLSVTSSDDRVHMICPGTRFSILNDDTFIKCANKTIEVSEGSKIVNFTLKREGILESASPFWFATSDGTAFAKSDYKSVDKVNKTFLPNQVYMTLSVDIVDDDYKEDDETLSVIIGSYVPKTLTSGNNCTIITIQDDDPTRMTEQQAQELLVKRRNFLLLLGGAGAFMALVVIVFISVVCYVLRRAKTIISKG